MTEIFDESQISECSYKVEDVGNIIKRSKIKHIWEFTANGKRYIVALSDSKLSGRKTVEANGKAYFPKTIVFGLFSFSFHLEKFVISIVQIGNVYECRINSLPINHLIEMQNNRKHFMKNENNPICTSSIKDPVKSNFSKLDSLDTNQSSDTDYTVNENKPFNFAIKPVNKDDKKSLILNVKNFDQFCNKMGYQYKENDISKYGMIDFHRQSKPSNENFYEMSRDSSLKNLNETKEFFNPPLLNKEIINKNTNVKRDIEMIDKNKKLDYVDDLFDIFYHNNNKGIDHNAPPLNINYNNIEGLVKDISHIIPDDNENVVYPKFDSIGIIKFSPQNNL